MPYLTIYVDVDTDSETTSAFESALLERMDDLLMPLYQDCLAGVNINNITLETEEDVEDEDED